MTFRRFVKSSSLYLVSNVLSRAIGFVMIPLYSRFLNPAEYGVIELIELTIQMLSVCIGLQCIGGAMIRIFHESEEQAWRDRVVSTALWCSGAANVMIIVGALFGAKLLSHEVLHDTLSPQLVVLAFIAMMFADLAEIGLVYARLRDRAELFVCYSAAYLTVSVGLNIYFIAVLRLGVKGFIVSKVIASGCGCVYLMRRTIGEVGTGWCRSAAAQMARFGLPLIVSNVSFFIIHFADRFFLSSMRGLTETGTYALAYRFAFIVTIIVGEPFGRVWSVTLYRYATRPEWAVQCARVLRYLTFALCLVGLALSVFGGFAIRFTTTSAYYPAANVLPALAFAYVGRELGDFFRNILYINKRSVLVGKITGFAALVNLALNFALIPRFGMYGAAWSTLITWMLYLALCWYGASREYTIAFPLRPVSIAVGLALIIYGAAKLLPEWPPVFQLGAHTFLIVQFVILIWIIGYFPRQEQSFIKSKLWSAWSDLGTRIRQMV